MLVHYEHAVLKEAPRTVRVCRAKRRVAYKLPERPLLLRPHLSTNSRSCWEGACAFDMRSSLAWTVALGLLCSAWANQQVHLDVQTLLESYKHDLGPGRLAQEEPIVDYGDALTQRLAAATSFVERHDALAKRAIGVVNAVPVTTAAAGQTMSGEAQRRQACAWTISNMTNAANTSSPLSCLSALVQATGGRNATSFPSAAALRTTLGTFCTTCMAILTAATDALRRNCRDEEAVEVQNLFEVLTLLQPLRQVTCVQDDAGSYCAADFLSQFRVDIPGSWH